jgi:hypothetical protein
MSVFGVRILITPSNNLTKENMIKCTLQEAVEKCTDKGGRFRRHDRKLWLILGDSEIRVEESKCFATFGAHDFEAMWVYEPLVSSFKAWETNQPSYFKDEDPNSIKRARKEGWNGAIDEVLTSDNVEIGTTGIVRALIEELKEG